MIISFLLDGIISNHYNFYSLFTLMYLIFINRKKNKYTITLIIGFLYDIAYTDTLFLNAFMFVLILYIIEKFYNYFKNNFINTVLLSFIIIFIYRVITYLLLCMIDYLNFESFDLITSIYKSLIINLIFVMIIYLFNIFIKRRKNHKIK